MPGKIYESWMRGAVLMERLDRSRQRKNKSNVTKGGRKDRAERIQGHINVQDVVAYWLKKYLVS
jgi:hypothetical protein